MFNPPSFHCHPLSLDSGSTPKAMLAREIELGTGYTTITDHGSLAGCRQIYDLARSKNVVPILGVEGYFRDDDCPILRSFGHEPKEYMKYFHVTIHAKDQVAYYRLVKEISLAKSERHGGETKPLFDWAALERIGAENCTIGSGCLVGMVQRNLLKSQPEIALAYYERLRGLCKPGNFFVEVFPHYCTHDWVSGYFLTLADGSEVKYYEGKKLMVQMADGTKIEAPISDIAKNWAKKTGPALLLAVKDRSKWTEREPIEILDCKQVEGFIENECLPWTDNPNVQEACNVKVVEWATKYGDPVVISDDSHFAHPGDKVVQDIRLAQFGPWKMYGNYHRQAGDTMLKYFLANGHKAVTVESWAENNLAWASGFKDFKLVEPVRLPSNFYPTDSLGAIMGLIQEQGRMDWTSGPYVERLTKEIDLLYKNGTINLLPYFLMAQDVVGAYQERGYITGIGRGSAGGLLLSYLIGITHIDPLKYGLSLERFLTLDRVKSGKLPDIDQDLPGRELLDQDVEEECAEVIDGDKKVVVPLDVYVTVEGGGVMRCKTALRKGVKVTDWGKFANVVPMEASQTSS